VIRQSFADGTHGHAAARIHSDIARPAARDTETQAQIQLRYLECLALLGRCDECGPTLFGLTGGELGEDVGPMMHFAQGDEGLDFFKLRTHASTTQCQAMPARALVVLKTLALGTHTTHG